MYRRQLTLSTMKNKQSGVVVAIHGGRGMNARLEAIGIRVGSLIIKKSSSLLGAGPVIVMVGNTEIAIGQGMASRIFVEVDSK